jgi:hypothetical protein
MDKIEIITTLKLAAVSHRAWLSNAQALIEGVPLDKEKIPVRLAECEFGKWYYGDGQKLKNIPGFQEIAQPHDRVHTTYMEIFTLLYGKEDREEIKNLSFFSRLIGTAQKAATEKREAAKAKSLLLQEYSTEVIYQLEQLQRVIDAMSAKELSDYLTNLT